jgi:hypothetical protein
MSNQFLRDQFLSNLKEGDKVIHKWGSIHDFYQIRHVARVTKTKIVLDNDMRFRKTDGDHIGQKYSRILEANESNLAIIDGKESKKRRINKARQITATRLDQLSEAALDAIKAIIDAELTN